MSKPPRYDPRARRLDQGHEIIAHRALELAQDAAIGQSKGDQKVAGLDITDAVKHGQSMWEGTRARESRYCNAQTGKAKA